MSLFPFIDSSIQDASLNRVLPIPKEYAWDFKNNEFILDNGKFKVVEGLEAIKVWVYKALNTQRYRYFAYSWNYGVEFENLIGNSKLSINALQSEAKRLIDEALSINSYIKQIKNFKASLVDNCLSLSFIVVTDYGEVEINV